MPGPREGHTRRLVVKLQFERPVGGLKLFVAVALFSAVHQVAVAGAQLEGVVGSFEPDGALDGCDLRWVGERRRLVPVLVALYVDAVQRVYYSSLVALTTHDRCLDCAVQDLVGVKLPTPGSDTPQIESPKAHQALADQQGY